MGYRKQQDYCKPPEHKHVLNKVTEPTDICIVLGTDLHIALPCWYSEVKQPNPVCFHNRAKHDYLGWPDPDNPDNSCQDEDLRYDPRNHHHHKGNHCRNPRPIKRTAPIHLKEEGYTSIEVITEYMEGDSRVSLVGQGAIDKEDDWIIRVHLNATAKESSKGKPYDKAWFRVSVFASGSQVADPNDVTRSKKDLVMNSKVCVLPTAVS